MLLLSITPRADPRRAFRRCAAVKRLPPVTGRGNGTAAPHSNLPVEFIQRIWRQALAHVISLRSGTVTFWIAPSGAGSRGASTGRDERSPGASLQLSDAG